MRLFIAIERSKNMKQQVITFKKKREGSSDKGNLGTRGTLHREVL